MVMIMFIMCYYRCVNTSVLHADIVTMEYDSI